MTAQPSSNEAVGEVLLDHVRVLVALHDPLDAGDTQHPRQPHQPQYLQRPRVRLLVARVRGVRDVLDGDGRDEVDHEPALQVLHGDVLGAALLDAAAVPVRSPKVDHDIYPFPPIN